MNGILPCDAQPGRFNVDNTPFTGKVGYVNVQITQDIILQQNYPFFNYLYTLRKVGNGCENNCFHVRRV